MFQDGFRSSTLGTSSSSRNLGTLNLTGKGGHGVVSLGWEVCLRGHRCPWAGKGASLRLLNTSSFLLFGPTCWEISGENPPLSLSRAQDLLEEKDKVCYGKLTRASGQGVWGAYRELRGAEVFPTPDLCPPRPPNLHPLT